MMGADWRSESSIHGCGLGSHRDQAERAASSLEHMAGALTEVPVEVRRKAMAQGSRGAQWLESLDANVHELERDWEIRVGSALRGGSDSYVAEATMNDGSKAILKLALPGNGAAHQIETLLLADGRGYVRLHRHDVGRQAMLLERLGAPLAELGVPVRTQIGIICDTLRRSWEVPADPRFLSGSEKAGSLAEFIATAWAECDQPCSERVVERALSFAGRRQAAFDPDRSVLVHGDAHAANTLLASGPRGAPAAAVFKFVDPDGLFAERACDLAVPMRGWSRELLEGDTARLGRERCDHLSALTGVDTQSVWEWGFIERVSTALLALRVGREELGREMLAVAEIFSALTDGPTN
jgi:streptomycin 6-kinase